MPLFARPGTASAGWLFVFLAAVASAAEPGPSAPHLQPPAAMQQAAHAAAEIAQRRTPPLREILIVVQRHRGTAKVNPLLLSARLKHCGRLLQTALEAEQLQPLIDEDLSAVFLDESVAAALSPGDVAALKEKAQFDAVLHAVYRQTGADEFLQLSLVDEERRHWSRSVSLVPPKAAAKKGGKPGAGPPGQGATKGGPPGIAGGVAGTGSPGAVGVPANGAAGPAAGGMAGGSTGGAAGAGAAANLANLPTLNQRVLAFAISQLGRQVGNGECWTLAAEALRQAGARPARGYTFGQQIPLNQIQPGDILQFKSARFEMGNSFYIFGAPDHTVVVRAVQGTQVMILHQNFGRRIVTELTFDFQNMVAGSVSAWRPVPF